MFGFLDWNYIFQRERGVTLPIITYLNITGNNLVYLITLWLIELCIFYLLAPNSPISLLFTLYAGILISRVPCKYVEIIWIYWVNNELNRSVRCRSIYRVYTWVNIVNTFALALNIYSCSCMGHFDFSLLKKQKKNQFHDSCLSRILSGLLVEWTLPVSTMSTCHAVGIYAFGPYCCHCTWYIICFCILTSLLCFFNAWLNRDFSGSWRFCAQRAKRVNTLVKSIMIHGGYRWSFPQNPLVDNLLYKVSNDAMKLNNTFFIWKNHREIDMETTWKRNRFSNSNLRKVRKVRNLRIFSLSLNKWFITRKASLTSFVA